MVVSGEKLPAVAEEILVEFEETIVGEDVAEDGDDHQDDQDEGAGSVNNEIAQTSLLASGFTRESMLDVLLALGRVGT
jgi:hypothetical protein